MNGHHSWSEVYRPQTFEDYAGHNNIVRFFQESLRKREPIPHLILSGPAGVGKTSLIHIYIDHYLHDVKDKSHYVLHVNASAIGNIQLVREKLRPFCDLPLKRYVRLIVLDEADKMTDVCQSALRRLIERKSLANRFVFIVNQFEKLHLAIRSRCQVFKFTALSETECVRRLKHVLNSRGHIDVQESHLQTIVQFYNCDMRKCVSSLQSYLYHLERKCLSDQELMNVVLDRIPCEFLMRVQTAMMEQKGCSSDIVREFQEQCYSLEDLLNQLLLRVVNVDTNTLSDSRKADICLKMAEISANIHKSHHMTNDELFYFQKLF